jgi:hypothetical protein
MLMSLNMADWQSVQSVESAFIGGHWTAEINKSAKRVSQVWFVTLAVRQGWHRKQKK